MTNYLFSIMFVGTQDGITQPMNRGVVSTDAEAAIAKFKQTLTGITLVHILNVNGIGQVDIP